MKTEQDSKTGKKKKFKKRYWILIDLAVVVIVLALLLYKPGGYDPVPGLQKGRVHPYLTYLSSEIYNGAQLQEPFDVVVIDKRINESIAGWSQMSEDVVLSSPAVRFKPTNIALMGTAAIKGVEIVVTIVIEPEIDENGLLNLRVDKVKTGAMNITPLATMIAKRMYEDHLAAVPVDMEDYRTKIVESLLNDKPFDPVFPVEDKNIRLAKITIKNGKTTLHFDPAP